MIETVISDLGQVLVHFNNTIFFERMTRYTRRSVKEIRAVTHDNLGLLTLFDLGQIRPEEFYERAVTALEADISYADFCAVYNDVFSLNEPVLAVIRRLKPDYRLVLLSNTDILRYSHIMRRFPQLRFFDAYVVSFEIGSMKPDPETYREALRRVDSRPESAVFIDDIDENVAGAERIGIRGILFTPETDLEAELRKAGVRV